MEKYYVFFFRKEHKIVLNENLEELYFFLLYLRWYKLFDHLQGNLLCDVTFSLTATYLKKQDKLPVVGGRFYDFQLKVIEYLREVYLTVNDK